MLDIAIYIGCAIVALILLATIFAQAREIKVLRAANASFHNDANGIVKRGERGRFVSARA